MSEQYHSPELSSTRRIDDEKSRIDAGVSHSREHGFAELKIQRDSGAWIPLSMYLATDVFRIGLSVDEARELLEYGLDKLEPVVDQTDEVAREPDWRERQLKDW